MGEQRDMSAVIESVIGYTAKIDRERDPWERGAAMNGMLRWDDERGVDAVRRWQDRAIETQSSDGNLAFNETAVYSAGAFETLTPTGSLSSAFGFSMLELHERTGEERYMEAATRQMEALMRAPRTTNGGICGRMEAPELWIDYTYMICPYLARFGQVTGQDKYVDEAFLQYAAHAERLIDPIEHLGRHCWCETPNSFPQSTFWSRGNGWFISAGVDLLALAPDHERAGEAADLLRPVLAAVSRRQDASGFLRHVLDAPRANFESSGTLMFAYAAARANQLGVYDDDLTEQAVRAVRVVTGSIDERGAVRGVAIPPGGPGVPFADAPFGQGFYLLACDALRSKLGLPTRDAVAA